MYRGKLKDGTSVYETGFPSNISQLERVAFFKKHLATLFNEDLVELKTNVKKIVVKGDKLTAKKSLYPGKDVDVHDKEAMVNAFFDMTHILSEARYVPLPKSHEIEPSYQNPNVQPKNLAHKDVKYWYVFENHIVLDGVPYRIFFNIRDKGKVQYEYEISFKQESKATHQSYTVKQDLQPDSVSPYEQYYTMKERESQEGLEKKSLRNVTERQTIVEMLRTMNTEVEHNKYFQEYLQKASTLDRKRTKIEELTEDWRKSADASRNLLQSEMEKISKQIEAIENRLDDLAKRQPFRNILAKSKAKQSDQQSRTLTKENTPADAEVKNSIRNTRTIPYGDQIRAIEQRKMRGSDSLYVGIPSAKLQRAGIAENPFVMNQADYRKSRRKEGNNKHYSSHAVPLSFFEELPGRLFDAAMLIDNGEKLTVITDYPMRDTRGNSSFVIVGVLQNSPMENEYVNLIKSIYPYDDIVNRLTDASGQGRLVVLDKKKAKQMFATIGVQPSKVSSLLDLSKNTLSQSSEAVKSQMAKSSLRNVTERQTIVEMLRTMNTEVEHNKYFQEYLQKASILDRKQAKLEELTEEWEKSADTSRNQLQSEMEKISNQIEAIENRLDDLAKRQPFRNILAKSEAKQSDQQSRTLTKENTPANAEVKNSIRNIVGESGTEYGLGVYLDSTFLDGLTVEEREVFAKELVREMSGKQMSAFDSEGNEIAIVFAYNNKKFKNEQGRHRYVNQHLVGYLRSPIKQAAVAQADEVVYISQFLEENSAKHRHDWLDDNGKNKWDKRVVYLQEKNNTVWKATLQIANANNGEKILYEIYPIKMVEGPGTSGATTTTNNISHNAEKSNPSDKKVLFAMLAKMPRMTKGKQKKLHSLFL